MRIFAALWIFVCCSLMYSSGETAETKPNVIVIFSDDMGYGDLSCNGGKLVPTPHIDQLAKEGIRFTRFYAASPICSPSRAGLLTGMYPSRWQIKTFLQSRAGNRAAGQKDFLSPEAPSMARTFQHAGYATAHIGKWHLGGGRDVTDAPPFSAYGYDEHVSTYESPSPDPKLTATNWIWSDQDAVKRWDRSAYFVDKTLDFLRRKKDQQPCFINFWPDDVHTPWVPKGTRTQPGKRQQDGPEEFKLVLAEYDRQIGRLMAGLKKLGVDQNTIVVFASDNGPGPDFPGNPRSLGMRGQKATLFEGGIRMPCIVRWPEKIPAKRVNDTTVFSAVDLFPSLCALAGISGASHPAWDGEDLSPIFLGKNAQRKKPIFWEFARPKRENDPRSGRLSHPSLAVRDGKWKLLVNPDGSGAQLYQMDSDPNETTNVAAGNPKETQRLTAAVLKWKESLPSNVVAVEKGVTTK